MKTGAITAIVIWSVAAVGLIVLLIVGSTMNPRDFSVKRDIHEVYSVEEDGTVFDSIQISWFAGHVSVTPSQDNLFHLKQTSYYDVDPLVLDMSEGKLTITQKRNYSFIFFGFGSRPSNLELSVPEKQYDNLVLKMTSGETDLNGIEASNIELKLTSGSLNASGLKAENISATMTSGNIDASDIQAEDLAIKVTSGKAELSGAFTRIESGLTSGKIIIHSNIASESIESKITSGKTFITIPENDGFVLIVKKTSGDIDCDDFDLKTSLRKSNDEYTYKTGSASGRKYYAKMTSGDFKLRKAK